MIDLLSSLNERQKEAVLCVDGPLLILAGAGSGKTRTIIHRIAYIIDNAYAKPSEILALTFTNKAAGEMKERIKAFDIKDTSYMWMGTFHSICARILRIDADKIGYESNFTIYDEDDSKKIIKQALEMFDLDEKKIQVNLIKSHISKAKDNLISPDELIKQYESDFLLSKIANVYKVYQNLLIENNAMDFDDLLYNTALLFEKSEDTLKYYQNRFKYILVDEYQDTNHSQYTIVSKMAKKHKNLCVCGDDDQSIYAWRGASIRNILEFEEDFKDAKVIKLEENYRSTKNILNAANEVIKNNQKRKTKTLFTSNDEGEKIKYILTRSDIEEAAIVANKIDDLPKHVNYKDVCVLYRTNAQSRLLEESFMRKGIPYQIVGSTKFYDRMEVKDILAYLKLIINPKDNLSFLRSINIPKRGVGASTLEKINEYANFKGCSLYEAVKNIENIPSVKSATKENIKEYKDIMGNLSDLVDKIPLNELIESLIKLSGYEDMLKQDRLENSSMRLENLGELINAAHDFMNTSEDTSLKAFLENASLVAGLDSYDEKKGSVLLMTLHNAKGLEFNNVYIVGLEEGLFPLSRGGIDESELEEERRLCYVGLTRARENLVLFSSDTRRIYGSLEYRRPSRFLKEIPKELIETENEEAFTGDIRRDTKASPSSSLINNFYNDSFNTREINKAPKAAQSSEVFNAGDKVKHDTFGVGTLISISGEGDDAILTAAFAGIGIKKFMLGLSKVKKVL